MAWLNTSANPCVFNFKEILTAKHVTTQCYYDVFERSKLKVTDRKPSASWSVILCPKLIYTAICHVKKNYGGFASGPPRREGGRGRRGRE